MSDSISLKLKNSINYILSRDLLLSAVIAICVICSGTFIGWYNNKVVPINNSPAALYTAEPTAHLKFLSNWDGPDYLNISVNGYQSSDVTNFFPLYPSLVNAFNKVIGSPLYSALLVSWLSMIGAIFYFIKVSKVLFKIKTPIESLKSVLLFILFPTAVFLFATYTEGLFAMLALGAIYYLLRKNYLISAVFALLAAVTHVTGVFLIIMLVMMLFEQKARLSQIIKYFIISCLGLIGYMIFLAVRFSNPLSFITAQRAHGWVDSGYLHHIPSTFSIINIFFIILLLASVVYWWRRKKSFSIYSLTFLLIPLVGGQFGGFDRYTLMAFPIQFMLYQQLKNKHLTYTLVLVVFTVVWTYTVLQYMGGYTGS